MIQVTTLSNGLRVATDSISHVETATLGVWVDVGSRHESPAINGVSHFLEHMAFKGTQRRTARQIAEEIENVGGYLNAYTSRESTAYHARILKGDVPLAMDLIADILLNSTFDTEEFAREQSVILQEIGQTEDTPDDIIFDYFQALCYPDHPLGQPILGTEAIVRSLTPEIVKGYMTSRYGAKQMVLSAAGNVNHNSIVKLAESLFSELAPDRPSLILPAAYVGGESIVKKDLEQTHVLLGFEGISTHHPDYYAASILSSILGGGMSSRLFQEIREKRGLVYSIYTFSSTYEDSGIFGVYANTSPHQMKALMPLMREELRKVTLSLTAEEIERAKAQYAAGLLMSLENTNGRCEQLASQMLIFGRPIPTEEMMEKITAVTANQLTDLAGRLFSGKSTLAIIGKQG